MDYYTESSESVIDIDTESSSSSSSSEEEEEEQIFPFMDAIPIMKDLCKNGCCNLTKQFQHSLTLKRESASNSVIIKGKIGEQDIAIKISPCDDVTNDIIDSLEYERIVYEKIPNVLMNNRVTPNMIGNIGRFTCDIKTFENENIKSIDYTPMIENHYGSFPDMYQEQIKNDKNKLFTFLYTYNNIKYRDEYDKKAGYICGTINEFLYKYKSLRTYIENISISNVEWKSILFQIFYNLHVLQKMKINHYDMHPGNIAIEMDTSQLHTFHNNEIYYVIDKNNIYKVPLRNHMVKFFDWDQSYVESFNKKNDSLEGYKCYINGRCNQFSPQFDIIHVVLSIWDDLMYEYNKNENIKDILYEYSIIIDISQEKLEDMNSEWEMGKTTDSTFMNDFKNEIKKLDPIKILERFNEFKVSEVDNIDLAFFSPSY